MSADEFRNAMALLAAPVAIVTTLFDGRRWGFTASAVTGLSLSPPLVSVAIDRVSRSHGAFVLAKEFVVNVLAEQHREIASRFARLGPDKFANHTDSTFPGTSLPAIDQAIAQYRCTRQAVVPVGDHDLVVGEVSMVLRDPARRPLLWYERGFHAAVRL
ncbi:flavin reductase family protein [Micromonospora sp. MH99]|uniref:flavin reductase family protein n=1 Tax=Micromonospora sp. MH99 TaxID=1945510 RepID=UPI001F2D56D8|nr:flavin reductase family protein [Micromonospora sp. MH99]